MNDLPSIHYFVVQHFIEGMTVCLMLEVLFGKIGTAFRGATRALG